MWKHFVSSYFSFTKKERNGIILLVTLIVFFLLLPFLFPFFIKPKQYDHSEFEKDIASLQSSQQDSNSSAKYISDDDNGNVPHYNKQWQNKKDVEIQGELFYFDPNKLEENGWKKLGVKDKTIQTIQKYLSKGGKFYKPEDISKIWGLSGAMVQRLTPYIKIEHAEATTKQYPTSTYEKKEYKKEIIPIDINNADTTAFIALPGIGNKLANRIVTFRNKLGGFYSIDQVGETFALPDSTFQKIKPRLVLNNTTLIRFNINTATVDEMKVHPYMRFAIANAIVQYRTQHGNYTSVDQIKNIILVTDEAFKKMAPYLKVN